MAKNDTCASSPHFRAEPLSAFVVIPLDDLTAVYHRRSGLTHLVLDSVPALIEQLGKETQSAAQLAEKLRADYDVANVGDLTAIVEERLEELEAIGLVERL